MRGGEGEGEGEEEEEVQVITLVTLTFRVWGFRVEPILASRSCSDMSENVA